MTSGNFYTGAREMHGPAGRRRREKQTIFRLLSSDKGAMVALLNDRGFMESRGSFLPFFRPGGERTNHDKDPAAYLAEQALLMIAEFEGAWRRKDFERAAEYAYLAGKLEATAYMHSRKAAAITLSKSARSEKITTRNERLIEEARQKCHQSKGRASVKELHAWLKPEVSLSLYHKILDAGGLSKEERAKIRKKFLTER